MKSRSFAVAALLSMLFLALASNVGAEEQEKQFNFRSSFCPDCTVYFEMPQVDRFFSNCSTTAFAKLLEEPNVAALIEKGGRGLDTLKTLIGDVSKKYKWGLALGYYPNLGVCMIIQERTGKAKELWERLLSLDSEAQKICNPVAGEKDTYSLAGYRVKIEEDIVRIAPSATALSYVERDSDPNVAQKILDKSFSQPTNGYFLFSDLYTMDFDSVFDAGLERKLASILGLDSIGRIYWEGSVTGGRFSDRILVTNGLQGWTGLAKVALERRELEFSGKVSTGSLASMVVNIAPSGIWNFAKEQVAEKDRVKFQGLEDLYTQNKKTPFADELNKSFSGNFEFAVHMPQTGFFPEIMGGIKLPDANLAKTIFELCNSEIGNLFPLVKKSNDLQINYRKPIPRLGYQPSCAFQSDLLLLGSSPLVVKKLAGRPGTAFPPQDCNYYKYAEKFKAKGCIMAVCDNQQIIKWAVSILPLLRMMGVDLPLDYSRLPLPEDASKPFSVSLFTGGADSNSEYTFMWDSDSPLLFSVGAMWLVGRMAGKW